MPRFIRAFEQILDLFHIGWVHVHHLMFLPIDLAKVWRARGFPCVVTVHDYYPGCPSFKPRTVPKLDRLEIMPPRDGST